MSIDRARRYELEREFPQRGDESDPDYQHRLLSEASVYSAVKVTSSIVRNSTPEKREQMNRERQVKAQEAEDRRKWRPLSEDNRGRSERFQAFARRERAAFASKNIPDRLLAISKYFLQWDGESMSSYVDRLEYQLDRDTKEGVSRKS